MMKQAIPLSFFFLFMILSACDSSDTDIRTIEHVPESEEEYPLVEELTEEFFEDVLNEFKIIEVFKPDRNVNSAPSYQSKSVGHKTNSKENCQHEITTTAENKDYTFDITRDYLSDPLTPDEIEALLNASVVSQTRSSVKYFLNDKVTESNDCDTHERNAPVPNHKKKDFWGRPKFYDYSNIFDHTGKHRYSNKFYIERDEVTEIIGVGLHSDFRTKGIVEKKVDRDYNTILKDLSTKHSYIENLSLTGFIYADRVNRSSRYKFYFQEGSRKYYKLSYTVKDELGDPTLESTKIDFTDSYKVLFYIRHSDNGNRTPWSSFLVPFVFEITIDLEEIVKTLKNNRGRNPYEKSSTLYMKYGPSSNEKREVGTIKYTLDEQGDRWTITSKESPLTVSDSQLRSIVRHYN